MGHTQVLIIGAGPTGLVAACALAKLGIQCRVIEKNKAPMEQSRALAVQAGTLECLERALGRTIPERMVTTGRTVDHGWIYFDELQPIRLNMKTIQSSYNYILLLEQNKTEQILQQHLHKQSVEVEREKELIMIHDVGSHVQCRVQHKNGHMEDILADIVIGCDGAHSTTPHLLNISFEGHRYPSRLILGDVKGLENFPNDSVRLFISKHGVLVCLPLRDDKCYRLIAIPQNKKSWLKDSDDLNLSNNALLEQLPDLCPYPLNISEINWISAFDIHHRLAQSFQKGRIFLAGDAAHIHSPIGGQGMNIGIQDALNLAFKLKTFFANNQDLYELSAYQTERFPIAKKIIRSTDWASKIIMMQETALSPYGRRFFLKPLIQSKKIQKYLATEVSEIKIARKEMARYGDSSF